MTFIILNPLLFIDVIRAPNSIEVKMSEADCNLSNDLIYHTLKKPYDSYHNLRQHSTVQERSRSFNDLTILLRFYNVLLRP